MFSLKMFGLKQAFVLVKNVQTYYSMYSMLSKTKRLHKDVSIGLFLELSLFIFGCWPTKNEAIQRVVQGDDSTPPRFGDCSVLLFVCLLTSSPYYDNRIQV